MNRFTLLLLTLLFSGSFFLPAVAQQATVIPIETASNAQVLRVDADKRVGIVYFGAKLTADSEYGHIAGMYHRGDDYSGILNSVYTPGGSRNLVEPAIEVLHADGNTSLDLQYKNHAVQKLDGNVTLTSVVLQDPAYAIDVTLFYKTYRAEDVVEQWTVIRNREKGPVTLHKFASANLYLSASQYWLRQYHGDWAREMQPEEAPLTAGIKVLDSKLGARAHLYQPPSFALSLDAPATEENGAVLLGTLAWSGNFRFDLEVDPLNNLRLIAGINPFQSDYTLSPGEEFKTPEFIYTFSTNGKGAASRHLHRWARSYRIVDGNGSRMTLLNNWEATYFDFNEPKLAGLMQGAKKLGVDLFLLDDGWFGNRYPRNSDNAGLGDWQENKQKLPHGIGYLVQEARNNQIKFGIWVEPEMVNPASDLYHQHPDWVIRQPERPEHLYRNQLVLDLSNPKVQDFVFGVLDNLFTKNPQLAFVKWDCNAVIYNAHSNYLRQQSKLYVAYVQGLYNVMQRVRSKYPAVEMMLCSGGGGRADYGALKYFQEFWLSDNTDPLERIYMQYEYSYFFPAITHCNHVTDWGKQPIKYRTDVAMMGKLGFDIVVDKLSDGDLKFCQQAVATYNQISPVIWHGDLFRLADPQHTDFASLLYVSERQDTAIVFNYLTKNRYRAGTTSPIKLSGLRAGAQYRVAEINLYPGTQSPFSGNDVYSGNYLMTIGFNPMLDTRRTSVILQLTEVK